MKRSKMNNGCGDEERRGNTSVSNAWGGSRKEKYRTRKFRNESFTNRAFLEILVRTLK